MKLELTMMSVHNLQQSDHDEIAEPHVHKLQLLKPTLIEKLDSYVPIKVYLSLTFCFPRKSVLTYLSYVSLPQVPLLKETSPKVYEVS